MKPLWLKIGCCVFLLGLAGGGWWLFKSGRLSTSDAFEPSLHQPITMPAIPSCFPGLSIEMNRIRENDSFFPENFNGRFEEWFSKHLRSMNESRLTKDQSDEVYRFLWLRSFHHPIAVRISRQDNQYSLSAIELSGAGGYEPGEILKNKSRRLSDAEWLTFTRKLEESCFWKVASQDMNTRGLDGAEWVLEGLKLGRYHVADVWSPSSGSYRDACIYLLRISGLGIDEKSEDLY